MSTSTHDDRTVPQPYAPARTTRRRLACAAIAAFCAASVVVAGREAPMTPAQASSARPSNDKRLDPLDSGQWGLQMLNAERARRVEAGQSGVRVGILDTGIDSTHPDLAANLNLSLSRNFVHDIPFDENGQVVDGPCEFRGCVDPVGHDDNGRGTHLAGVVAAAVNGRGISGVAPGVTLVDVRVGQDSGFFFLQPVVDGIRYAADAGLDVVVLGFTLDPWPIACTDNPADSPEARALQTVTITAITNALEYAHQKGVTIVGALGDRHEDLDKTRIDTTSPTYPVGTEYSRTIPNTTCRQLPVEGPHVIGVSGLGPSEQKADYSNYGIEQTSIAGPGGYFRDFFGTDRFGRNSNMVLSTYPRNVLIANGQVDPSTGAVTPEGEDFGVVTSCDATGCGYYVRREGTAIAAAHVAGVAALIVSQFGGHGSVSPDRVERVLAATAVAHPCPTPPLVTYQNEGRPPQYNAMCEGDQTFNSFYGYGIPDAFAAITRGRSIK